MNYCCKVENGFGLGFLVVVDTKLASSLYNIADRQVVPDELWTVSN